MWLGNKCVKDVGYSLKDLFIGSEDPGGHHEGIIAAGSKPAAKKR
jgi:hypothetical protein